MSDDKHGWTHAQCDNCWNKRENTRIPTRLTDPDTESCCYCGIYTRSGIYRREKPVAALVPYCPDVRTGWDASRPRDASAPGWQPTDHPGDRSTI